MTGIYNSYYSELSHRRLTIPCNSLSIFMLMSCLHQALEEGAVANLIAMSLEGKEKTIFHEELSCPEIRPSLVREKVPPECISDVISDALWLEDKVI
jgi:hypothetical protein